MESLLIYYLLTEVLSVLFNTHQLHPSYSTFLFPFSYTFVLEYTNLFMYLGLLFIVSFIQLECKFTRAWACPKLTQHCLSVVSVS